MLASQAMRALEEVQRQLSEVVQEAESGSHVLQDVLLLTPEDKDRVVKELAEAAGKAAKETLDNM
jgi:hypothetical protein